MISPQPTVAATGAEPTVHVNVAGVGSGVFEVSIARTAKLCAPTVRPG